MEQMSGGGGHCGEVGANVDYERFCEKVLIPMKAGHPFSYRSFACGTFTLSDPIRVTPRKRNIIEEHTAAIFLKVHY